MTGDREGNKKKEKKERRGGGGRGEMKTGGGGERKAEWSTSVKDRGGCDGG